jgi:uncharacterized Fe-S cluster-containing radical SAM superfamily protein
MNIQRITPYRVDNHNQTFFNCGESGEVDAIELKCLLISRGVKIDSAIYKKFGKNFRINSNPMTCNSINLPDGTNVQLTDMDFHLKHLTQLSWSNLKSVRYASQFDTPFQLKILDEKPALFCDKEFVCFVTFHKKSDFYTQKTSSGLSFLGNAVLQGSDLVSFQCLWHCEYAAAGKPCQYCFMGADFEARTKRRRTQPSAVSASNVAEIVRYAVLNDNVSSIQISGGSTFFGETEHKHIVGYLKAIAYCGVDLTGEILLHITPPDNNTYIDEYFSLGASRIACNIEVWDKERAKLITPGKIEYSARERYLKTLTYIAEKFGKAYCTFIIGLESVDTLREGATWLAERGIIPAASVWMPLGRPVTGNMIAPDVDYFRRVKDLLADIYSRYKLSPAGGALNVCIEKDIHRLRVKS